MLKIRNIFIYIGLFALFITKISSAEDKSIKIGVLLAQTGDLGAYGKVMKNGAILASEMINENGGVLGGGN